MAEVENFYNLRHWELRMIDVYEGFSRRKLLDD